MRLKVTVVLLGFFFASPFAQGKRCSDIMKWPPGKPSHKIYFFPLSIVERERIRSEAKTFEGEKLTFPERYSRENQKEHLFLALADSRILAVESGVIESVRSAKNPKPNSPEETWPHQWNVVLKTRKNDRVYYVHVDSNLKKGQRVNAGDLIGFPNPHFPFWEHLLHFHMVYERADQSLFIPYLQEY